MYKANVTTLSQFAYFLDQDWYTEDRFINDLLTPFDGNELSKFGTDFHTFLENPSFDCNYTTDIVAKATEYRLNHRHLISEIPVRKNYNGFLVTARIDGIEGLVIHEHKTSTENKLDHYLESYQWRFYLDMLNTDYFQYNMWVFDQIPSAKTVELYTAKIQRPKNNHKNLLDLIFKFQSFIANYPELKDKFFIDKI